MNTQMDLRYPENGRQTVEFEAMMYARHSRHRAAHVMRLRERKGW
ncbi:hypothetical protein GCM10011507_17820 [Edaphobacter acidisoli]|uniref:Uncharacterized protein n=1 Tax=Edaphobacter acidisoli TaxID=2040573 RepID=A0A916RSD6_9BACT|nr:hypothetical protein [Edaphobacter acidisoli]GGA66735.1 hypothetical protein GCM10011507_17820 [Edaphobacter acidisoli]